MNHQPLPQPGDEEALQILAALETLSRQEAAVQKNLSKVQLEALEIHRTKREIQRRICYYKAIITPLRRMPVELLAHIFGFLMISAPDAVFQVSRVCRIWRKASMFAKLWSNIVVTAENPASFRKTRLYLRRSARVPLEVTYIQSEPSDWHWSAWNELIPSSDRWSTLSLTFDDCKVASREIRGLHACPNLTELSIEVRGPCSNLENEGQFGFESPQSGLARSPLLRSLRLSTFILPTPGPLFLRLTSLHITDTYSRLSTPDASLPPTNAVNLLRFLVHCPNLEDFGFDAEATVPCFLSESSNRWAAYERSPLSLPHLQRLHLSCHYLCGAYLLRHLHTGALKVASLQMRPRYDSAKDKLLEMMGLQFFLRCKELRSLRIMAYSAKGTVAALVGSLHDLEILHLEFCPDPDLLIRLLTKTDRFEYFNEPRWLIPSLGTVIIDAQPFQLVHDNLATFVKSRYCYNLLYGFPRAIGSLVVNGQDMLKGAAPGEIAEFVQRERFGGQTWQMHQGNAAGAS